MAGKWDYSLISRIQQANDIIDVISEHLSLDKKGKEMVGLCPFHSDHKPSMYVNPEKQIFKCFACGAGGDVLKFVQMKEHLTFPQAVERLAQRAGIPIEPVRQRRDDGSSSQLDALKLAKINAWALKCWTENLRHPEKGAQARHYIESRGLSAELAKKWQLGLAVDAWDDLVSKASEKKDAVTFLVQAGLAVERDGSGCYDKFRNRLMFPILDVTGRVIGFGGRTLGDDPAKYMNSPATALFNKSHSLYGLYQAREAISQAGTVIVAEGYTDVMMAHQFGVENVVAALGTSLTDGHAKILRRYTKRIVLLFDSDVAGKAAANRALEVCLKQKIDVRLGFVPDGKDPCDYLLEAGADAFRSVVDSAQDVLEFKWDVLNEQLQSGQNLSDRTEAIRQFLQTAAGAIEAGHLDSVSRTVVISRLSTLLGISSSRVENEIAAVLNRQRRNQRPDDEQNQASQGLTDSTDLATKAQCEILEVLLALPNSFQKVADRVSPSDFGPNEQILELANAVFDLFANEREEIVEISKLYARIESPQTARFVSELQSAAERKEDLSVQLEGALAVLENRREDSRDPTLDGNPINKDEELKNMLKHIAQKGPNLRSAGI